jgi:hypothetical protein
MNKEVWYLAHPVSGAPRENAHKAIAWIKYLTLEYPERIFIAPWVAEVLAFADDVVDPAFYDRVLSDDEQVVARCDGVLMVGTHVSPGMAREAKAARLRGKPVVDITGIAGTSPEARARVEPITFYCGYGEAGCVDPDCSHALGAGRYAEDPVKGPVWDMPVKPVGLPTTYEARKKLPVFRGPVMYFPNALLAVAEVCEAGNQQHNPGEPLHWAREKSTEHMDTALRHMMDHGLGNLRDTDGTWHLAKAAWRLLAELQLTIEKAAA